jgi:ATP-dependent RNA helicase RhlE
MDHATLQFQDFGLLSTLNDTLKEKELQKPTEIQARVIPLLLKGRSVVGVSQTGSGKTLAFVLPILHAVKDLENQGKAVQGEGRPRALVMVPTRDLGEQVTRVFKPFTHTTRVRVRSALGGTPFEVSRRNVGGSFEVLIATPGRLAKLLESKHLDLSDVRVLIFDEADQMLDPGFLPDANRIVEACPAHAQMGLFTATLSKTVKKLMDDLFVGVEVIRTENSHRLVSTLKTENRKVIQGKRLPLLDSVLQEKVSGGTLFFTNTREQCDTLSKEFEKRGIPCVVYRGEMDKVKRRQNLKAFREGQIAYLISTDLASRGLDIDHVGRVVNYHLPQSLDNYFHRVGRTARAGRKGRVINFVTERDQKLIDSLEELD